MGKIVKLNTYTRLWVKGEEKEREKWGRANTKTTIASVGISFYKVVFPVTVLSIVVNISSQSKHTSRERGMERLRVSLSNILYLITDT